MLRPQYLSFLILAALTAAVFWSCDRMTGDVTENQPPVVYFVNVPLDSAQFNYAPTVYWFGYDPDGLITAYQYNDDQSAAAVAAYDSDAVHPGTLLAYINSLPPESWVTTENTQETIYLLTNEGDTTQHVFIVRSVDNLGLHSSPKVRVFFRTNHAPDTPELKKTPTDEWEIEQDYSDSLVVNDTLLIGDAPSLTWPGIQFVWKGTDPDSRELNIIPLEFQYLLTNVTTNQVMPYPRIIDSTHVEWVYDWSDWSDAAQLILSEATTHSEMETGRYKFELRVRDDGLTLSDTNATAWFNAIRPSFAKQLLIVDENKPVTGPAEPIRGGYSDSLILAFYYDMIPQAFGLAEALRPYVDDDGNGIPDISEPFVYDTSAAGPVAWFRNKNMETSIPLDIIQQFKWVWIIDDDNPQLTGPGASNIEQRQRAMGRYMNVGGQVMISGRRIFAGSYNIPAGDVSLCTNPYGRFFCNYFHLQTANSKGQFNATNDVADFGGATTASLLLPDVRIDSAVVCSLRFGTSHYCCLPEVDFFGRGGTSGYDYSETVYNYSSCTSELPYDMTNVDGQVLSSTPTQAILSPDTVGTPAGRRHTRVLSVSRVYNVTRDVFGEVMGIRVESNQWQIVVSTPVQDPEPIVNYDCGVLRADSTHVILSPDTTNTPAGSKHSYVVGVTRVYNVTRDAYGEVSDIRYDSLLVTAPIDSESVINYDCRVLRTDTTQVILSADTTGTPPGSEHAYVLQVTRVYNATRGVYGEVTRIGYDSLIVSVPIDSQSVVNYDCRVLQSDTTHVILSPDTTGTPPGTGHSFVLQVTRVYNVTRGVYGSVTGIQYVAPNWQILVSTPYDSSGWQNSDTLQVDYIYLAVWQNGDALQVDYTYAAVWRNSDLLQVDYTFSPVWRDSDLLQVDYTYIPISISQDKPIGARFFRIEGTLEVDQQTGDFLFIGETRYSSAIFTFPFSFLDRTPVFVPGYGDATPAAEIVATQLLFFNSLKRIEVSRDDQ